MKSTLAWACGFGLALAGSALADEPSEPPKPPDLEEMHQNVRKAQEEAEQRRKQDLERLKELNPEAYQAQLKAQERQAQIGQVMSAYQQQKITAEDAERRLTPLIRQEVQQELAGLDDQIRMTEKKLAALRRAKGNPNALVKKRVDQMLGRSMPSPDEMF